MKGSFKPVGKALAKDLLRPGRLISKQDEIVVVPDVVVMIPVGGPILAVAIRQVDLAEKLFASKMGAKKKEWAKAQLRMSLLKLELEEKYIDELVSIALLVVMRRAAVRDLKEPKPRIAAEPQKEPEVPVEPPEGDEQVPA